MIEGARGVGVDGVGTGCFANVHGDEVRLAAADYYDGGWGCEGEEGGGGDGGGEGADVFLAVLLGGQWEDLICLWGEEGGTYTAEEMADENYEDSSRSVLVVGVEAFECSQFLVCVEDGEVGDFFEGGFCGWVVVDLDIAHEVRLGVHGHGGAEE